MAQLAVHYQQLLLYEFLESPQAVEHALDVELLLYLRDALVDLADEVAIGPELVELPLDARDLLEGAVGSYELGQQPVDFFLVQLARLLPGRQQVADLHLFSELLDVALEGVDLLLDLQVSLVEGVDRSVYLANLVGV